MISRQGNRTEYVLGTGEGWDAFDVVRFHATEALSEPFRYEIVLQREAQRGPVAIGELVGTGATLRIATEDRWRPVHGLVTEGELVDQTERLLLYRVVVEPHAVVLAHRKRCRTFVDRSLVEIVETVLEGLSLLAEAPAPPPESPAFESFTEPGARFRWALSDEARARTPRRFVVQYNESDLAFVSRLLEDEGLTYFYEHASGESVLTITDRPGHTPLFPREARHELVGTGIGGATAGQQVVRVFRPSKRLRAASVKMRDYAWRKSLTTLEASASADAPLGLEHYEFPARDEDAADPGVSPARFQMERFEVERHLSVGRSNVRTHEPGYRFRLVDRAGVRDEEELLLVRTEVWAQQLFPEGTALDEETFAMRTGEVPFHETQFQVVPARLPYRPERKTKKPEVSGLQTARVTAEELGDEDVGIELNNDEMLRVRVRFPWDQRDPDGTPSSKWIRVAQYWAGPGFGSQYVPRVGHEVLVAFERGDPDRPIIVGRLYNAQNPPPYPEPNTTKSTLKSDSVGSDGNRADGFNELRFEDAAEKEQIFLHAQRNLDEVVRASHSTTVGGSQSNSVGGDQSNTVYGSRVHHVHGNEGVEVDGNRTTWIHGAELRNVDTNRVTNIFGNDGHTVSGQHAIRVHANQSIDVAGLRSVKIGVAHVVEQPNYTSTAYVNHGFTSTVFASKASATHSFASPEVNVDSSTTVIKAGSAVLSMQSGLVTITNGAGATIALCGSLISVTSGTLVDTTGTRTLISGGATNISSGGDINAGAPTIKLNG